MKINKKNKIILVTVIILLILIGVSVKLSSNSSKSNELTEQQMAQIEKESEISKLSNWEEKDRVEYYATTFLRNLEFGKYKEAYEVLYDKFKNEYFQTQDDFERYMKEYFPSEIITEYKNIERLGNTYILWVDIQDAMNSRRAFSMNIVIRENDYDDIDLSFSVNSAKEVN